MKTIKKIIKASKKSFSTNVNKKKLKYMMAVFIMLLMLVIATFLTPTTLSRYVSQTQSSAAPSIAFYLLKTDYKTESILLNEIIPRSAPYTHKFTVANNDGTKRTETNLKYDLSIRTTTNLPLTYELYLNSEYTDNNAENIIGTPQVIQDSDGTYFNVFTTDTEYFSHAYDESNEYQLVVYFPSSLVDERYQDIIDSIEITVDSEQVLSSD